MQVYKVFMKMARKRLVTILMYFGIFALICFIMTANAQQDTDYSGKKLKISVADMDNTEASRALRDYIAENHDILPHAELLADDKSGLWRSCRGGRGRWAF